MSSLQMWEWLFEALNIALSYAIGSLNDTDIGITQVTQSLDFNLIAFFETSNTHIQQIQSISRARQSMGSDIENARLQ